MTVSLLLVNNTIHGCYAVGAGKTATRVEVQDLESLSSAFSSSDSPPVTKITIEDVPTSRRDASLIKYYLLQFGLTTLDCNVVQYGKTFLVTFQEPIGKGYHML